MKRDVKLTGIQSDQHTDFLDQQKERIRNELLPLAIEAHRQLPTDKATPAGARANAVRFVYDQVLGPQDDGAGKEIHELTAQELADAIARLQHLKAERAKPVINGEVVPDVFD